MRALLAFLVLAAPALAAAGPAEPPPLEIADRFPVAGSATTILVPPEAATIEILYSPGSRVEEKSQLAVPKLAPPAAGKPYQVVWRPVTPGVVQLSAAGQSRNVSIRYDGVPLSGIAMMLIAALILFGGAALSLRALLVGDD